MRKAIAVMKKDFNEIRHNFQVFGVMIILPIMFGIIFPIVLYFIISVIPPAEEEMLIYLINTFNGFFLLMSVSIPIVVAADSFAGEKERKTIEALLAAPISDSELFLGKVLVSFLPTVILTYLSATIYCTLVNIAYGGFLLPNINFLFQMAMVPLFTLLFIELTVFISVRVKGFREAQQLAGVLILPVLAIMMLSFFNISVFNFPWNVILLISTGIADIGLWTLAIKKFGRENIISKI